jgi:hypothetical protein
LLWLPRNIQGYIKRCSAAQLQTAVSAIAKKIASGESLDRAAYAVGVFKAVLDGETSNPSGGAPPSKPEKGMECIAGNPVVVKKDMRFAKVFADLVCIGEWCIVSGDHPGFQAVGLFVASNGAVWATDSEGIAHCLVTASGGPVRVGSAAGVLQAV